MLQKEHHLPVWSVVCGQWSVVTVVIDARSAGRAILSDHDQRRHFRELEVYNDTIRIRIYICIWVLAVGKEVGIQEILLRTSHPRVNEEGARDQRSKKVSIMKVVSLYFEIL